MRTIESFEESCEYRIQPTRIFKTFVADLYETDQIGQTVICYPLDLEGNVLDVEIKMMILVKPESIRDDVAAALWAEYQLTLGDLKFTMAPKEYSI